MADKKINPESIIRQLRAVTASFTLPLIDQIIEECGHDSYLILISCLLSLRVKDTTTIHVCRELFARIRTPYELLALPLDELERIIFRTGFYRNKARVLRFVSQELINRFDSQVPQTREELLSIKGIGHKTANLVLGMAFGLPYVCVDTHVHRISNRLGLIKTKSVEQSELELEKRLPKNLWIEWNTQLVMWGQNICGPLSPKCSQCPLNKICKRVGVTKSR